MTDPSKRCFYVRAANQPTADVALGKTTERVARARLLDLAHAEACRTLSGHHVSCAEMTLLDADGTPVVTALALLFLVEADAPLLS